MDTNIPAEGLRKTICYYYLLAYCPPENVGELREIAQPLRADAAALAKMDVDQFFEKAAPEVSRHILAFHQNSRQPATDWVEKLNSRITDAEKSPGKAMSFQMMLGLVSRLPQRAKPENRLHHRRGCQFCAAPCHYGYFTLISKPSFERLQEILEREHQNSAEDKRPVSAIKAFALSHIRQLLGVESGTIPIQQEHLAHLAYCLLTLATSKSRLHFPEKQFKLFQTANQFFSQLRMH